MLARTHTATVIGLEPHHIEVEVDSNRGTPNLLFIGLPSRAVEESKERITSALRNCGIRIRSRRTVVNLAPADLHKSSPVFELAITIGLLKMYGELSCPTDQTMFFGELSLNGELKPIRGALPLVLAARQFGFSQVCIPAANQHEVAVVPDITIHPLNHLNQYLKHSQTGKPLPILRPTSLTAIDKINARDQNLHYSWNDVRGQHLAKRALVIAAAGGHNVLLMGPPGSGKSMLAQTVPSLLPSLSKQEAIEVTAIQSLMGINQHRFVITRPFRQPHHSITTTGLVGGGNSLHPGEISLAHHGVLFLDELTEFSRRTLESLRQPLENKEVSITRNRGSVTYPARFTLIAAANPCPCGWYGSSQHPCTCSPYQRSRYIHKLSGPLLDRIDIIVMLETVSTSSLLDPVEESDNVTKLKNQVMAARKMQTTFLASSTCRTNSELDSTRVRKLCKLTATATNILNTAGKRLKLTARSYIKTIRVAQTIAHLEKETTITEKHMAEALQYRAQTSIL